MAKPDLSKLTKEEKLKLLDAIEEKKRRQLSQRPVYTPNAGQRKVHESEAMLRAVFAGNGGGKTTLGVQEAIWAATGYNPVLQKTTKVPTRGVVVLDKPDKVDQVWMPELKKWIEIKPEQLKKNGKPYVNQILFPNGSEIYFMFHDMEPMSFESLEVDWVIFDEPPPRHIYVALRRGGRKKGSQPWYLIIGTPISAAWMRVEIYEPWAKGELPGVECFKYGTKENKENLRDGYIEEFSSVLSDKEKRIRLEGDFFDLEGLALAHLFNKRTHVIPTPKWPANWPVVVVVDPHPTKAHVSLMLGVTQSGYYKVLKEYSSRSAARAFARELKEFMAGYRVVDIISDSLGNSASTGGEGRDSFIAVLKDEGIRIRATTYDEKSDEAWIEMIRDYLLIPEEPNNFGERLPKLQISEDCIGLISDVETVQWAKVRNLDDYKPKLDIARKDHLACLKYALASRPSFEKGRERPIRTAGVKGGLRGQEKWRAKFK